MTYANLDLCISIYQKPGRDLATQIVCGGAETLYIIREDASTPRRTETTLLSRSRNAALNQARIPQASDQLSDGKMKAEQRQPQLEAEQY